MPVKFANRTRHARPSDIREIISKTAGGGYMSFAGGMPDPALFPAEQLGQLAQKILREHPERALQYGPTAGLLPLREKIAALMGEIGVKTDSEHIQIISGAQQGLALSGTVFLDPGDTVITERPTYSAAINALDLFRPTYLDLDSDDDGPDLDQLRHHLRSETPPRLAYVIPNFQNPSGRLWSASRREAFLEAFADKDTIILEDDPYGQLAFHSQPPQPIKASDRKERVIFLGSFSKVLSPGLRVGWIVASTEILAQYNLAKQNHDLHTSAFDQELINAYLEEESLVEQIQRLRTSYAQRCAAMLSALETEFPEGTRFTRPEGGLFTWVELPEGMDAREILALAMEEKVVFIPGDGFFSTRPHRNTMRLNFSAMGSEQIKEGMSILGRIVREQKNEKGDFMTKAVQLKGYAYPSPKGISSLVGDLPWHYGTEHLDIVFTADPKAIASFLPEPLQPGEHPDRVVISFGKWWSLWENGLDLPAVNPERTWYMETILWVGSSLHGKQGKTCIQSWVDNDFTMARGMYMGFNKKLGKTVMTDLQPMNPKMTAIGAGTQLAGYTVSHGERLFEGKVTLKEQIPYEDLPDPILKTPFNIRYFPSIVRDAPPSVFEVVKINMENFRQSESAWVGEASINLLPSVLEEYMVLEPREVLGGYYFFNGSTVLGGEVLHSWV